MDGDAVHWSGARGTGVVTRSLVALFLCLGPLVACRPFSVCSSHAECQGGRCVMGKCMSVLDGGIDADEPDVPLAPVAPDGADAEVAADGKDAKVAVDLRRRPEVPADTRDAGDVPAVDGNPVDGAADTRDAPRDYPLDAPPDGAGYGLIGYVKSYTGAGFALWVYGLQAYVGDWGPAPTGQPGSGTLQAFDVHEPKTPVMSDWYTLCDPKSGGDGCEISNIIGDATRVFVSTNGKGVFAFNMLPPRPIASFAERLVNPGGTEAVSVSAMSIATINGSTFLLVGTHGDSFLRIYDVTETSELKNPVKRFPVFETGDVKSIHAMEVDGARAYLLLGVGNGEMLQVLDLSPLPNGNPIESGRMGWNMLGGYGRMRVRSSAQGSFLYVAAASVTEENIKGGLRIVDVSNPPKFTTLSVEIEPIGTLPGRGPGLAIDDNGNWAYVVTKKGLQLIDISAPTVNLVLDPRYFYKFPEAFTPPCYGGRAVFQNHLVYATALCRSEDGTVGQGGLAIYYVP